MLSQTEWDLVTILPSLTVLDTQIQLRKYKVQMYHLQLLKYGIYAYAYKMLGTRTLVRNVISTITLFLGRNDSSHIIFTCNAFSRNIIQDKFGDSLQFYAALPPAVCVLLPL